jgi:hypothetical protein
LDYVFAVPLRKFMGYQLTKFLPWWIQRYVFMNKQAKLEPLYRFHGVSGAEKYSASIRQSADTKEE